MKTLTMQEIQSVTGAGFFNSSPGWGATIGGILGGRFGTPGALAGTAIGHAVEHIDYHGWGERYKNSVMDDINRGNIPAD